MEEDLRDYKNLLRNMKSVKDRLGNAYSFLNDSTDNVSNAYSIDGTSADGGYLKDRLQEIASLYNSLKYTIIPRIERKIEDLEIAIEEAEEDD